MNNKDPVKDSQDRESRREILLKIGAALAVASVPLEGKAQKKPPPGGDIQVRPEAMQLQNVARIPANIRTPFSAQAEKQTFSVFFANPKGRSASVLVIPAGDQTSVREAANILGASPAMATVVGGVIHVNLGTAGNKCTNSSRTGAVSFGGPGGPVQLGPIQRKQ